MPLKQQLKRYLDDTNTQYGRRVSLVIQGLIVVSLIAFSIETLPNLPEHVQLGLHWLEATIVLLFTIEYVARIYAADKPMRYIFSFYGLIDLIAILPFYITLTTSLTSLRIFRLLRLFRIFKLGRYSAALERLGRAILSIREELVLFTLLTSMLLFLASVGIYYFEHEAQPEAFQSIFHAMWWSVATFTTVGYGDIYPVTAGGKLFTFMVLMIGLGIVAVPTGLIASALSLSAAEARRQKQAELRSEDSPT